MEIDSVDIMFGAQAGDIEGLGEVGSCEEEVVEIQASEVETEAWLECVPRI
jgi:ATP-dependent Clp protease adapter protein ClpS